MSASASSSSSSSAAASGSKRTQPGSVSERRVQPRHFHCGPNPSVATSSNSGEADADPQVDAAPLPVVRLYRDALQSVFTFLGWSDLQAVLRVSTQWLGAVKAMGCLDFTQALAPVSMTLMARSAVGRHVGQLGSDDDRDAPVQVNSQELSMLATTMAHLRVLNCQLSPSPPGEAPGEALRFPAALQRMDVHCPTPVEAGVAALVNTALHAIGRLASLKWLAIHLPHSDPLISLAPLAQAANLRELVIHAPDEAELSDAQIDELRALPWLCDLYLASIMTTEALRRLLRQPHGLQWQQLYVREVDDEIAVLFTQLPSLTTVICRTTCTRFDWLLALPNLTEVDFTFEGPPATGRVESLIAASQRCSALRQLSLCEAIELTASHLADLLPRLPALRTLKLISLQIDSLAFLAQQPMMQQLDTLLLRKCAQLPVAELRHVLGLRCLTHLRLVRSFSGPLDDFSRGLLKPPSLLLPTLIQFIYISP